jgi:glycosyltransferase involved in cell wall biosynthesis
VNLPSGPPTARPPVAVVSHSIRRTHGQGRINLEIVRALSTAGRAVTLVATDCEPPNGVAWHRVHVPGRLPTNWLRETVFRLGGEDVVRQWHAGHPGGVLVSNGAAVISPGAVNLAMFVHAAWRASPWHPSRSTRGWHAHYQAAYNAYNAVLERRAFRGARQVVAISELIRDELVEFAGVNADRIVCISPGVDTEEFRPLRPGEPGTLRTACGLRPADVGGPALLLMFAGEIRTGRKNLGLVLAALAAIPTIHLAIAGSVVGSPYPDRAIELGVADRVHFLGHREDLPALFRSADAFVFPSHYEPFGLVVTEAMASGLPVVVTRQCGAAASVTPQAGVVLDNGAALDAVVAVLERWSSDPSARAAAARAARAAAERCTWKAMGELYVQLIGGDASD